MTREFDLATADSAAPGRIIVSQQPTVGGDTGRVLQMIAADMVMVDVEEKGLFTGLAAFVQARPVHSEGAVERAITRITEDLRFKASCIGADAVLNVQVNTTRGVDASGSRLVRLSAVGTAVRLGAAIEKED